MIVFSGGVAEAGEPFLERIREAYHKYTWTKLPNPVRMKKASVGYDAGIIGAAFFSMKQHRS
jgi:glucokinase